MNQRWLSLIIPLEGLETYENSEIVISMIVDQIVANITQVALESSLDIYIATMCVIPDHYLNTANELQFYAEVSNEVVTLINYIESTPQYNWAMDLLMQYVGRDFQIPFTCDKHIVVLIEDKP